MPVSVLSARLLLPHHRLLTGSLVAALLVGSPAQSVIAQQRFTVAPRWPPQDVQLPQVVPDSTRRVLPSCTAEPVITPESLGPIRVGSSVLEILDQCPDLWFYHWWEEGVPYPAAAVVVGGAILRMQFQDTTSSAPVVRAATFDPEARTASGIGPGSSVAELAAAVGPLRFGSAECAIYAWSESLPGLSWLTQFPPNWTCLNAEETNDPNGRVPPSDLLLAAAFIFLD